MNIHQHALNMV